MVMTTAIVRIRRAAITVAVAMAVGVKVKAIARQVEGPEITGVLIKH